MTLSDSCEQARAILRATAGLDKAPKPWLAGWQACMEWLALGRVDGESPFARALAEMVDCSSVRIRRDFNIVLNLIRAHALLHQATRRRTASGAIEATIEQDYAAVRALLADLLAEAAEVAVPDTVRETVRAVQALHLAAGQGATLKQVAASWG